MLFQAMIPIAAFGRVLVNKKKHPPRMTSKYRIKDNLKFLS